MENLTKQQRYMQDKKQIKIAVNEAVYNDFVKKLKADRITQKYMLETAINRYIEGIDHYKK